MILLHVLKRCANANAEQQVEQAQDTVPVEAVLNPSNEPAQTQPTGEDNQQTPLPKKEDAPRSPGLIQEAPEAIVDQPRAPRQQLRAEAPSFIPGARSNGSAWRPSVTAGGSSNAPVSPAGSSQRSQQLPARLQSPQASLHPQSYRPSSSRPTSADLHLSSVSPPLSSSPLLQTTPTWQPSGEPCSPSTGNTEYYSLPSSLNQRLSGSETVPGPPSPHPRTDSPSRPAERPSPTSSPARNQPLRRRLRSPPIIWESPESPEFPDRIAMAHQQPSHPAYHQAQGRGDDRGHGQAHHQGPPPVPPGPTQRIPAGPAQHAHAGPLHYAPAAPTHRAPAGTAQHAPLWPAQRVPAGPSQPVRFGPIHPAPLGAFPPAPPHLAPPGFDPRIVYHQTTVQDPHTGAVSMGPYYPYLHTSVVPGPFGHPIHYPEGFGYLNPTPTMYPATNFGPAPPVVPFAAMPTIGRWPQRDPFAAGPRRYTPPPGHIALGPTLSMPRELPQPGTGQVSQAPGVSGVGASAGAPARSGSRGSRPLVPTVPESRLALARGVPADEGQTARNNEGTVSQRSQEENPSMGPGQPQQNRLRPVADQMDAVPLPRLFGSQVLPSRPIGPWNPTGGLSGFAPRQAASVGDAFSRSATPVQQESGDGRGESVTPPDQILEPYSSGSSSALRIYGTPSTPSGQPSNLDLAGPFGFIDPIRAREEQHWAQQHQAAGHASQMLGSQADRLGAIANDPARFGLSTAKYQANRLRDLAGYSPRADPSPVRTSPAHGQIPAADLARRQLVSAFERVFQNLATYADGYSSLQGVPLVANTVGGRNMPGAMLHELDLLGGDPPTAPLGPAVRTRRQRRPRRWLDSQDGRGLRAEPEEADAFHERLERVESSPGGPARESGPQ